MRYLVERLRRTAGSDDHNRSISQDSSARGFADLDTPPNPDLMNTRLVVTAISVAFRRATLTINAATPAMACSAAKPIRIRTKIHVEARLHPQIDEQPRPCNHQHQLKRDVSRHHHPMQPGLIHHFFTGNQRRVDIAPI
jgi:hypothetical protein